MCRTYTYCSVLLAANEGFEGSDPNSGVTRAVEYAFCGYLAIKNLDPRETVLSGLNTTKPRCLDGVRMEGYGSNKTGFLVFPEDHGQLWDILRARPPNGLVSRLTLIPGTGVLLGLMFQIFRILSQNALDCSVFWSEIVAKSKVRGF